jgi:hypothetical protein
MPGVRREKSGKSAERLARSESSVFLMVARVNGIALSRNCSFNRAYSRRVGVSELEYAG